MKSLAAKLLIVALAATALSGCIIVDRSGSSFTETH